MSIRIPYVRNEKKLQKVLSELLKKEKKSKVILVGYRGKMFYLSDLLLHVIGFG